MKSCLKKVILKLAWTVYALSIVSGGGFLFVGSIGYIMSHKTTWLKTASGGGATLVGVILFKITIDEKSALLEQDLQEIGLSLNLLQTIVKQQKQAELPKICKSCHNCYFYSHELYLKCAVHPDWNWSRDGDCPDWEIVRSNLNS